MQIPAEVVEQWEAQLEIAWFTFYALCAIGAALLIIAVGTVANAAANRNYADDDHAPSDDELGVNKVRGL